MSHMYLKFVLFRFNIKQIPTLHHRNYSILRSIACFSKGPFDATLICGRCLFLSLEKDTVLIGLITINETAHSISTASTSILGYFLLLIWGNLGKNTTKY